MEGISKGEGTTNNALTEPSSNISDVNQNAPIPEGEICTGDSQDNDGNGLVD